MKKLILSVMLTAFAVAVQAGEGQACADKAKASCCPSTKASVQAKSECSSVKQVKATKEGASCNLAKASTCSAGAKTACKAKDTTVKQALLSPKAASAQ